MSLVRTGNTDRDSLSIGAERIQRINRTDSRVIIEVTIFLIRLQAILVRIGIRAITTTIYIIIDAAVNTYGITTEHITRYVITTIYIVDITTRNQHTGSIVGWEEITVNGLLLNQFLVWVHICHTASAIDIMYSHT